MDQGRVLERRDLPRPGEERVLRVVHDGQRHLKTETPAWKDKRAARAVTATASGTAGATALMYSMSSSA